MGHAPGILAQVLIGLDIRTGRDLALDPILKGGLLGDPAGGAQAKHKRGGIIAFGVGEVAEIQGGFDGRVVGGQVKPAARPRARDVGRHAKGVDGCVVAQACGVQAERDLVAVHHDVGDVVVGNGLRVEWRWLGGGGVGRFPPQKDARVRVHGRLVGRDRPVEFPDDNGLRVVEQVLADAGEVFDHGDGQR